MPVMPEPTEVEAAYAELRARLQAVCAARDYCPGQVFRNRTVATLAEDLRNGAKVVWNLLDETGELLAEEIGDGLVDGPFEVNQPATLEIAVIDADDTIRDRTLDANLIAVRDFILTTLATDPTLGGVISRVGINRPPDRLLLAGINGAKAVRIRIDMLMELSTVLG